MHVGVCDFPARYDFPPTGYAGIERWLWATAVGARRAGAVVHLLGRQWRPELAQDWDIDPVRLEDLNHGADMARLRSVGFELIVAWHEYPAMPAWRDSLATLGADVASFQHGTNIVYPTGTYDGKSARLYCYSPEMMSLYADQLPRQELAVHLGLYEDEPIAVEGRDLLWLGRIDTTKAPHLAIMAAEHLGRRIRIVGPVFDQEYLDRHIRLFSASHVDLVGEIGGSAKAAELQQGRVLVYTCKREYVEAGAAVFGEALRAGTPVAALAWRDDTCADAALCPDTGRIARIHPDATDEEAVIALAAAIEGADTLTASTVQEIGRARFDPARHFLTLAERQV